MRLGQLRNGVSTKTVAGGARRATPGQTPLVEISVKGRPRAAVQKAANALAQFVVNSPGVSGYVDTKITSLEGQLTAQESQLDALADQIDAARASVEQSRRLPALDRLVPVTLLANLEERRGTLEQDREDTRALLSLARYVERARVVDPAVAVETTARSKRNSMLVGGLLGLLLGALVALLWEPVARRVRD